jgi:hypothetical protein
MDAMMTAEVLHAPSAEYVDVTMTAGAPVRSEQISVSSAEDVDLGSHGMYPPVPPPVPPNLQQQQKQQQEQQHEQQQQKMGGAKGKAATGSMDFTEIPKLLDEQFEAFDEDSALRPTRIRTGEVWTRKTQKRLLSKLTMSLMPPDEQRSAKNQAFDLLDALSRSGALPITSAELHVMVAATHCFDKSLLETVIQDNVNPIEKLERSALIVASTIHGEPAIALLNNDQQSRVATYSPGLLANETTGL